MNTVITPDFNEMPIAKLREYAKHMQIPMSRDAKKEELIDAIKHKLEGRTAAVLAEEGGKVPPGHAKIVINEDPTPGSKNFPIYMNVNGYQCTIPRGKEVIVPQRIVRALADAKVKRRQVQFIPDQYGREFPREVTVTVPSYPYQVLEMTPGEEPLTPAEIRKKVTFGPRKRYAELFGHWPRPAELRRAVEKGLIKIQDDEHINLASDVTLEESEED